MDKPDVVIYILDDFSLPRCERPSRYEVQSLHSEMDTVVIPQVSSSSFAHIRSSLSEKLSTTMESVGNSFHFTAAAKDDRRKQIV